MFGPRGSYVFQPAEIDASGITIKTQINGLQKTKIMAENFDSPSEYFGQMMIGDGKCCVLMN